MTFLLMFFSIAASLAVAARIAVLLFRSKRRKKERLEASKTGCVIFHEEIDDVCVIDEVKKSCILILGAIIFPAAMIDVLYFSRAGLISKLMVLVSVIAGIIRTITTIENRQA